MYDTAITMTIMDRLGGVLQDLLNHPTTGLLVLGGIVLIAVWLTRR